MPDITLLSVKRLKPSLQHRSSIGRVATWRSPLRGFFVAEHTHVSLSPDLGLADVMRTSSVGVRASALGDGAAESASRDTVSGAIGKLTRHPEWQRTFPVAGLCELIFVRLFVRSRFVAPASQRPATGRNCRTLKDIREFSDSLWGRHSNRGKVATWRSPLRGD
jgi:hypothetical protein